MSLLAVPLQVVGTQGWDGFLLRQSQEEEEVSQLSVSLSCGGALRPGGYPQLLGPRRLIRSWMCAPVLNKARAENLRLQG